MSFEKPFVGSHVNFLLYNEVMTLAVHFTSAFPTAGVYVFEGSTARVYRGYTIELIKHLPYCLSHTLLTEIA